MKKSCSGDIQKKQTAPVMEGLSSVPPTFSEALRFWLKLGFINFGGPTGQIAIMHEELVEKRNWISEARFLHALNYCMLLPGPEATQLATYIGWLLHKTWGGIAAGVLFVLPSTLILWALSYVYLTFGKVAWVGSIFYGLKPAVLAIVAAAVIRVGKTALKNEVMWSLAGLAFTAIYFLRIPFPLIIFGAGMAGLIGGNLWKDKFLVIGNTEPKAGSVSNVNPQSQIANALSLAAVRADAVVGDGTESPTHVRPSLGRAVKVCGICLLLWWLPVLLVGVWLGRGHTLFREGVFFSKAAMVTFGGAYAVLPYVSQQAVENYHWLDAGQMLDGLGLAETTPGPMIIVLQFVGFLGGWNQPGGLPPLWSATLGAFITTWTTFVPCFLWIFLGAPHIEQMRGNLKLATALSAVTAAVVGVILNLAVWFGLHVLFPGGGRIDGFALAVSLIAFFGILKWKWDIIPVIIGSALLGLVFKSFWVG